jgi:hypothetical protein
MPEDDLVKSKHIADSKIEVVLTVIYIRYIKFRQLAVGTQLFDITGTSVAINLSRFLYRYICL